MNKMRYGSMLGLAVGIPVLGAMLMYALIHFFPMGRDSWLIYSLYAVLIIFLGLIIPYGFLKAFSIAAHEWDGQEKELKIEDIPKDKEQLDKNLPAS